MLINGGLSPKEFNDSPFFSMMESLNARKREDRVELIDPLEAINETYELQHLWRRKEVKING
ncbi:hypothetical protein AWA2045_17340 [Lactiplantibacillus plantarum]|nr:hypothetical protein AWA2045_17340 [Lactiplantibacillus plantarum]